VVPLPESGTELWKTVVLDETGLDGPVVGSVVGEPNSVVVDSGFCAGVPFELEHAAAPTSAATITANRVAPRIVDLFIACSIES
jgi:hypothetical protein